MTPDPDLVALGREVVEDLLGYFAERVAATAALVRELPADDEALAVVGAVWRPRGQWHDRAEESEVLDVVAAGLASGIDPHRIVEQYAAASVGERLDVDEFVDPPDAQK